VRKLPPAREGAASDTVSQSLVLAIAKASRGMYHTLPAAEQKLAREVFDHSGMEADKRKELESALTR
jgi:hypothetical protein